MPKEFAKSASPKFPLLQCFTCLTLNNNNNSCVISLNLLCIPIKVDERFFWNYRMLEELTGREYKVSDCWVFTLCILDVLGIPLGGSQ